LEQVLSIVPQEGKPLAVLAHTVRGYGSPTMTDFDVWFHKAPNDEELEILLKEVDAF
jgi:transketolase